MRKRRTVGASARLNFDFTGSARKAEPPKILSRKATL